MKLCECGCGERVKPWQRFVNGHHRRGKKHTSITKIKMSDAARGRKFSEKHKKNISNANKGYKQSEEHKRKLSEAQSGERGSNWQGGISFEPYCPKFNYKFKESVREKFSRVCFLCGEKENGMKLDVHHVNYDKSCLCSEVECEFVPLCRSCHMKTNTNRKYYESMIREKLLTTN